MTTPPNRQPEGIPAGGQFAPAVHAEPEVSLASSAAPPRIMAAVTLQAWSRDYAIDIETVEFDAGPILAEMTPEQRSALEDSSSESDSLYQEAVRRGFVKDHDGPFYVALRDAINEAEESDPEAFAKIAAQPRVRQTDEVLHEPLTPYELGARADENGWVEGLATFDMDDLIDRDLDRHGDQIGEKLVGSELLMDVTARPVSVTAEGSIVCRLTGDASAIIDGFDDDDLAAFEAGRAQAARSE